MFARNVFGPARIPLLAALCALVVAVGIAPASADAPSSAADVSVAQTMGDRELTVVLRRVTSVPGPLRVEVVTHRGSPPGTLALTAVPTGATTSADAASTGIPADHALVRSAAEPGAYSTTLQVNRPGPWELTIDDGARIARIPFVVPAQVTTPPERLVYGGFLVAGLLLPVAAVVALRARRTSFALVPAAGVVAGVAVAVTAALLSASLPLPPQPAAQLDPSVDNVGDPYALNKPLTAEFSRPAVLLSVVSPPLRAGVPGELELLLSDAATGNPVDDLLVHDSALVHLLAVSPSGRLAHLHPVRIAPGRFQVHLAAPEAGRNALSVELSRRGGGVQIVRAATGFEVSGAQIVRPAPVSELGSRRLHADARADGAPVSVRTSAPIAGTPTTITANFGSADLQPWLGMVGHLIMAGPIPRNAPDIAAAVQDAPIWGHGHSMGAAAMPDPDRQDPDRQDPDMQDPDMSGHDGMHQHDRMPPQKASEAHAAHDNMLMPPLNGDSAPDETVAAYGPDVAFTYTFPAPGRYRLWIQAERDYAVLTVPVELEVGPATGARP